MKMFKTLEKSSPYRKKSLEGKVNHLKTCILQFSAIILGGGFWNNSGDIIYTLLEPNIAPENERLEDDRFLFGFRPIVRELH